MRILKIISRLLDYPQPELLTYRADLALEISDSREVSPGMRLQLLDAAPAQSQFRQSIWVIDHTSRKLT